MLELQRNVVFGQFVDTGSAVHRVDARVKIAVAFVCIVASFLIDDLLGFGLALALMVGIQALSRIPLGFFLRGSAFFFGFLALV